MMIFAEEAMNEAQKLYEEYQEKLKHLQETCSHESESGWIEEWWAPGHSTGRKVKVCNNCNKVLQGRMSCRACGQEFLETDLRSGDGRVLPMGAKYCEVCYSAACAKAKRETQKD